MGIGRIVRSEGPTLPMDRGAPNRMSSPECIQHPAALGDAASNYGQASFLPYCWAERAKGLKVLTERA